MLSKRSVDGKSYSEIGTIFSAGEENAHTNYVYKDKNAQSTSSILYYRLKSVDKTGDVSYSPIRLVRLSKDESTLLALKTYPNPFVEQIRVTVPANWQGKAVSVEIISSNGAKVQASQFGTASQTETLQVGRLNAGFYIVKAVCGNEVAHQSIVKN